MRYQKPFRGCQQVTNLSLCCQDFFKFVSFFCNILIFFLTQVRHTRLLSLALPKGWLPQLVLLQDESFEEANLSVIVYLQYYIELKYIV